MSLKPLFPDEALRLAILKRYSILDTPAEAALDDVTSLAAAICETPMALITLVDEKRQWFKSKLGVGFPETTRESSFCAHLLNQPSGLLIIPDATADPRFADNPLVTGDPGLRFYAGAPLVTPENVVLGSLCVLDKVPRTLTSAQETALQVLARQVMTQLELRKRTREMQASERKLRAIFEAEPACVKVFGPDVTVVDMNPAGMKLVEASSLNEIAGRSLLPMAAPEDRAMLKAALDEVIRGGRRTIQTRFTGLKGTTHWVEMTAVPFHDEDTGEDLVLGVSHEITGFKLAEEKERRLNRLYAVSSAINGAIVRTKDTQELYDFACRIAVELGGLAMAWVGLVEMDGSALHPAARCGKDHGYLDSIRVILGENGRGPASRAIRTGALAYCEDIAAPDAEFLSRAEALERGYRSCAAFPLKSEGSTIGCLIVYGDQPGYFGAEELQLLNALAENISFAVDAHERERRRLHAEAALRESERVCRDIVEASPDTIVLYRGGRIAYVNTSGLKMLGADLPEQLIGRSPMDLFPPDHHEEVRARIEKLERGPGSAPLTEKKMLRLDGTMIDVESAAVSFVLSGELVLQVVSRDITERKRTAERFSRLVEANAQGVFFYRLDGTIIDANDRFLTMTGYTREDLQSGILSWKTMTPGEFEETDRRALEQLRTAGACEPFEKEYIRKDGSRVPLLLGAARFEYNHDEGVAFAVDLTERKKLEQQFLRAQRMESVGTLAGGIAHDLNNVLGPIITAIELLNQRFQDPESQELISILSSSAYRGADMVRQVLSFARGLEGKRMEVQVKHLVREVEKIVNDTFLKHIQVRARVPSDLWTVMGDPTQLHQVLLNLCVNARDAMPDGGVLTISAENLVLDSQFAGFTQDARPGPYVFLQVEDTGTGIPPEVLDKMFEPFFTTKDVGSGTGLGLSTSMAIVKSHGGFIRVYSEVGKGSRFNVYLPATTDPSAEKVLLEDVEKPRGSGQCILIVDDEESVRRITSRTLELFGYQTLAASDGTDAIGIYAKHGSNIALVLTDMTMPGLDGPGTVKVLRHLNPAVKVIATSGLSAKARSQAAAAGIEHFLAKPYTAEALLKLIRQVLETPANPV